MDNSNITILIVDDTVANLQVLTTIVTLQGYNILLAQSGEEALRVVKAYHPDIILLDIMMSKMDGFEVCRLLKANPETKPIPVIFVTARTDVEAVEKGFDVGGDDYVSKPFNDRVLLARLKTHIERYRLQREIVHEHSLMNSVLEDSPIMFCRFNENKELQYLNQAFTFWFRGKFPKLTGQNLLELFPDREELDFIRYLDNITIRNQSDTKIYTHTDPAGKQYFIQWNYRGIFDQRGKVSAYQCFGKDVTEQEMMIRQLNARNTLLEHAQFVGKMMNWEMDPETKIVNFEGDVSGIIGGVVKTFQLKTLFDYTHPDDISQLKVKAEDYLKGNKPASAIFRIILNNVVHHLRISAFYERDKEGNLIAYRGVFQDISELVGYKERSEQLQREKATIFEAIGEGIIMFDLDYNIVQANDAAAQMVGIDSAKDILGKKCHSVFHNNDTVCSNCTAQSAIAAGRRVQVEKIYMKDKIWSVSTTPVYNEDHELVNIIEVLVDTTELHQQQRELILSRERLNTAFNAALIGTFTIQLPEKKWIPDIQLMNLYGIQGMDSVFNMDRWYELIHQDDVSHIIKKINTFFEDEQDTCRFEFRIRQSDDQIKWFRCSMQVIEHDEEDKPKLIIGVSIDFTKEHGMLDTIKQQDETLAQTRKLRALGQLTGGIAHDFNNMLATILGFAELLEEELKDDEELSYYCKNITDTCERAATLTSQLLTFSRKQSKQSTAIDMHDLILNSMDLLRHSVQKNIRIMHMLKAKEHFIMGEFSQLQNMLLNIGFNARDAMPEGGDFELWTENIAIYEDDVPGFPTYIEAGNYFVLHIRDTGIGMDKEVLSKIFEPFFTTKSAGKGTGLGLSTVYGTVTAHNGSIYAESTPGKGTVFHIYFPISALKPKENSTAKKPVRHKSLAGSTILIVDDEEPIRKMLRKSLEYMGYMVKEANSGEKALTIYKNNPKDIHVVILDVVMPGMDGVQIYKELKKCNADIAVIISSGFANSEQTTTLKEMGVNGYLKKPYRQSELVEKLTHILGGAEDHEKS
ncbi:MAG: response regulator [FCB group bacterium]|nr:response regulator [FCB group bacterium]